MSLTVCVIDDMSLTVLAPLRGCCGVRGKWTCGTVRATWYHGPGLVFGLRGHETTLTPTSKKNEILFVISTSQLYTQTSISEVPTCGTRTPGGTRSNSSICERRLREKGAVAPKNDSAGRIIRYTIKYLY
ncbi:hypothetical protein AVEN_22574-1 [Araneus ventricosus]|uniref:Uncharacterized protein n=1 Tax=Araneus ventricosus TaxID=182803 RepID=A0A4Y2E522_ARAVE|nr:hypothetical protein AVEN_22574-1 [Araneus ventricosus]